MVIKNLENKIKLVMVVCALVICGCVIISLSSLFVARGMVDDAHKKVYVLDGTVPVKYPLITGEQIKMQN